MTRTALAVGSRVLPASLARRRVRAGSRPGTIEGAVTDKTAGAVAGARVVARNLDTGFTKETDAGADGFYRLLLLPVGAVQRDRRGAAVRDAGAASRSRST